MKYWVYENWTVCKGGKAKTHRGNCSRCNNGHGQRGKPKVLKTGMWHGPFSTLKEAKQAQLKKVHKVAVPCSYCLGKAPLRGEDLWE